MKTLFLYIQLQIISEKLNVPCMSLRTKIQLKYKFMDFKVSTKYKDFVRMFPNVITQDYTCVRFTEDVYVFGCTHYISVFTNNISMEMPKKF